MNQRTNRSSKRFRLLAAVVGAIMLCNPLSVKAQLDPQISQHMLTRMYYNPAATGVSGYINAFALARIQWVDWEGAPNTQLFGVHGFLPDYNSGVGLCFMNDQIGFEKIQYGKLTYAYHLTLNEKSYLSMGLSAGVQYQALDYSKTNVSDVNDPNMVFSDKSKFNPDFGVGLEYNREDLKIGLSASHITRLPKDDDPLTTGMHFYGYARYDIPISFNWTLMPSLFAQQSKRSTQLELGALGNFQKLFWLGTFLRMDEKIEVESWVFMAGVNIMQRFKIGYAFDYNLLYLKGNAGNSHEIYLSFQLPYQPKKYDKTPRFFE